MSGFSSADFGEVAGRISVVIPDRLKHADVLGTPSERSGAFSAQRKHLVKIVDLPSKTLSVTLGGLSAAAASGKHRHNYETIIYVLSGSGKTVIEDREVSWRQGDAIYIPVWAWHQHFCDPDSGECRYLACENAPLLQNLGGLALREEAP